MDSGIRDFDAVMASDELLRALRRKHEDLYRTHRLTV